MTDMNKTMCYQWYTIYTTKKETTTTKKHNEQIVERKIKINNYLNIAHKQQTNI